MMWKSISHAFGNNGPKRESLNCSQTYEESSDETYSEASTDEGLECPICWESFNIVENMPLLYKGNLKCPSKNFFLLWMVECRNGERGKSPSALHGDVQLVWTPRCTHVSRNSPSGSINQRTRLAPVASNVSDESQASSSRPLERRHLSLQASLDFFFRLSVRIPLVFALVLFVFAVLPTSAVTLLLYLLITVLFGVPSFLVLYFAYPALDWLAREITT
ncbi:ubiquitin-protein ligase [Lithospermum erythrorhizon]|uniref:Ubiquitin-protein ligase n=1 Tax=Lithospermum erythrorhizon TaxID=34254 RepID=A0AAV3PQT8_LITER